MKICLSILRALPFMALVSCEILALESNTNSTLLNDSYAYNDLGGGG